MKFLTTGNNSMGFFTFILWGLANVNESEYRQGLPVAENYRIMTSRLKTRSQQHFMQTGELILIWPHANLAQSLSKSML